MISIEMIEPYKNRWKIRFSNGTELLLYQKDIRRFDLSEGDSLSSGKWSALQELLFLRAKERALYLLDRFSMTEMQMCKKLHQGYYPSHIIDLVLQFLKENHFLDDYQYACMYIDSKKIKKSRRQIICELSLRGISRELLDQVLENRDFSDDDSIMCHIRKKNKTLDLSDERQIRKLYRYLMGRGYHYSDIQDALRKFQGFVD